MSIPAYFLASGSSSIGSPSTVPVRLYSAVGGAPVSIHSVIVVTLLVLQNTVSAYLSAVIAVKTKSSVAHAAPIDQDVVQGSVALHAL